jgi:hypothetical protein
MWAHVYIMCVCFVFLSVGDLLVNCFLFLVKGILVKFISLLFPVSVFPFCVFVFPVCFVSKSSFRLSFSYNVFITSFNFDSIMFCTCVIIRTQRTQISGRNSNGTKHSGGPPEDGREKRPKRVGGLYLQTRF